MILLQDCTTKLYIGTIKFGKTYKNKKILKSHKKTIHLQSRVQLARSNARQQISSHTTGDTE